MIQDEFGYPLSPGRGHYAFHPTAESLEENSQAITLEMILDNPEELEHFKVSAYITT